MYELQKNRWLKHLDFAILDILAMECLYFLLVRILIPRREYESFGVHKHVAAAVLVIALLLYVAYDSHRRILHRSLLLELVSSLQYMLFIAGGILIYLYLAKESYWFSRTLYLIFSVSGVFVLTAVRSCYKLILTRRITRGAPSVVLITDSRQDQGAIGRLEAEDMRCHLAAVFTNAEQEKLSGEAYALDFSRFEAYRNEHAMDEVILDITDELLYDEWLSFLLDSGLPVHVCIDHRYHELPNAFLEKIGGLTVLSASTSVAYPGQLLLKRLMDIAGSLLGLLITGVAFLIFAPVIRRQSPGPVFYSQLRVGRNGRQFRIYKFRSMYPDADARKAELMEQNKMEGQMFKLDDDPRVIPVGHFLRKHSIDELPQFWNVLKGEMSLVGTRPPTLDEWERYSPHHRARLSVKPGLTGMWQVSGRSNITDFEEVVRMDTEYIRNWSILLDVKLILRTVAVVLGGDGAS